MPQDIKDRMDGILVAKSSQKQLLWNVIAAEEMDNIVEEASCNALIMESGRVAVAKLIKSIKASASLTIMMTKMDISESGAIASLG